MLNIVGGGESYEEVIAFINKNKLNDRVFIHGQLSFHELAKYIKKQTLLLFLQITTMKVFRVIMESWSYGIL